MTSGGHEMDELVDGYAPPPPRPPDVIHVIGVPRPCFSHSSASVHYTERKLKKKKQGRPVNKAR